jgi:hypothetical protein
MKTWHVYARFNHANTGIPMDINFHDPSDIPLPPEEVHIRELRVEPLPDQRRVRIFIEITPFQQKPNLEIKILTKSGREAASLSIIEAIDYKMQFTVHLKDDSPSEDYTTTLEVYYFETEESAHDPGSDRDEETHQLPERVKPVDERQVAFTTAGAQDAA